MIVWWGVAEAGKSIMTAWWALTNNSKRPRLLTVFVELSC